MEVAFDDVALKDLQFWRESGNIAIQKLLLNIKESPYTGIGKPEALKYGLTGSWSRRINDEHRIIYSVHENIIQVHSLEGHYN